MGKRVMRFGSDEETFLKWDETLKTCGVGLQLVGDEQFDAAEDQRDFDQDMEYLQSNLIGNLSNVSGLIGTVEMAVEGIQQLLEQQKADRSRYKTQVAVKAETSFKVKLIKFEKIIGIGGNFKTL